MATEGERCRHGRRPADAAAWPAADVDGQLGALVVGGRGTVLGRPTAAWPLDGAGVPDEVARDALARRDRDGPGAEHLGDGRRLGAVVVGVDVPWALTWPMAAGASPASARAISMAAAALGAVLDRGGGVGVAGQAVARHLAEYAGAPVHGPLVGLQHQEGRPLAHDEAVAVVVEGPGHGRGRGSC